MISGSCFCGRFTYKISVSIGDIVHCHCGTCRKAHGAAFSNMAAVPDDQFSISGSNILRSYESSKGKHRYFDSNSGTQIYAKRYNTEHVVLRLGSLDDDPEAVERSISGYRRKQTGIQLKMIYGSTMNWSNREKYHENSIRQPGLLLSEPAKDEKDFHPKPR